jgi:hypothetical protein
MMTRNEAIRHFGTRSRSTKTAAQHLATAPAAARRLAVRSRFNPDGLISDYAILLDGDEFSVMDSAGRVVFSRMGLPEDGTHGQYADWADWHGYALADPAAFQRTIERLVEAAER